MHSSIHRHVLVRQNISEHILMLNKKLIFKLILEVTGSHYQSFQQHAEVRWLFGGFTYFMEPREVDKGF